MTKAKTSEPIIRNSAGLRSALFDELDALRQGNSNPSRANATAKLADQIVNVVKMEMEVQRHAARFAQHAGTEPNTKQLGTPIALSE